LRGGGRSWGVRLLRKAFEKRRGKEILERMRARSLEQSNVKVPSE